jgi:restriction endonuclease Mrr
LARTYLNKAGLLEIPARAEVKITELGRFIREHDDRAGIAVQMRICDWINSKLLMIEQIP